MSESVLPKLQERFEEVLDDILENEELRNIREVKNAIDWYRKTEEASKEKGGLEALMLNKIKDKILESLPDKFKFPEFLDITFNKVAVSDNVNVNFNVNFTLPSVKTHVDFVIHTGPVSHKMEMFAFQIDTEVDASGAGVSSEREGKRVSIESLAATVTVYLLSPMIIGVKKIKIGSKEFALEKLVIRKTRDEFEAELG
jgi:hypothetical protein